jgi:putative redox protein
VFTRIHITYLVTGHKVDLAAVLRSIELSVTKYCAAYAMMSRLAPIEQVYEIYEDMGDGKSKLVQQGLYQPNPN